MSYTPTVWKTGDVISSANLNKLENGVAAKQDALTFDNSPTANSTNPVTSGGIKTALDAKQDNLTFDQTPTASSANPVTSGGVYTALETKANKEDVTKEISKETARSYMTESASGAIVKFSDGADDIPMEEVRVNFSPIQNLNGYDHPWIGGAGKNKYSGTQSISLGGSNPRTMTITLPEPIPAGTYFLNAKNTGTASLGSGGCQFQHNGSLLVSATLGTSFTVTDTITGIYVYLGQSVYDRGETLILSDIQIELGTAATSFEPYSNICPISGRTGVNVEQRNRNLLVNNKVGTTVTYNGITWTYNNDGTVTAVGTATSDSFQYFTNLSYLPKSNLIFSGCPTGGAASEYEIAIWNSLNQSWQISTSNSGRVRDFGNGVQFNPSTCVNPSDQTSVNLETSKIALAVRSGKTVNLTFKPMIRLASDTDSTYAVPTSKHHAITWADKGTIYGGYVNNNGKLVAEWAKYVFTGNESQYVQQTNRIAIKALSGDNIGIPTHDAVCDAFSMQCAQQFFYVATSMTVDELKAYFVANTVEVCYKLATPIEYDIDAVEIKSLYGDNVMWSDGDTVEVDYRADTAKSVNNKIEEAKSQTVSVSGTAPTITAAENTRYICGEVVSLSFTPSSSGVSEVIFTAGSTVPVVTLPSTVKMPEWYEIEANHVYEISVLNGVYGAVMSWAV